jgi:OmcA/MtrC family decaheme c-type cytochrome
MVRFGLAAILALGVAVTGCGDDGGGPGGSGAVGGGGGVGPGGTGGGGTGGGGTGGSGAVGGGGTGGSGAVGGGGTGGTGGVLDLGNADVLAALVEAGLPLVAGITDVQVQSPPVMTFTLKTQGGTNVMGLPQGSARGTFVKLIPPQIINAGTPDERVQVASSWQSYINNLTTGTGDNPAVPQALQATREEGTFEDMGDGTYVFTYVTDVTDVTSPVPISWEPTYTTRAGLEIRISGAGVLNPDNPTYDFVPDGSSIVDEKDIAATANCNNCHQRLSLHGGGRFTEDYCVTCHNNGTRDPEGGESVSMAYMAHSIHASAVRGLQDKPYIIIGRGGSVDDFSEVTYPQDVRECTSCHKASAETPEGDDWATTVNALACGGCHVDTVDDDDAPRVRLIVDPPDATTGLSTYRMEHIFIDQTFNDGACRNCHNNNTFDPPIATATRHAIVERIVAQDFQYNILDVTMTDVGQNPEVTFSVTNPNDGDSAYDLSESPFDNASARLAVMLAWPSSDYTNIETGSAVAGFRPGSPAQNVSMDPLSACVPPSATCTDNANGTYTITSLVEVPSGLTGTSLAVAMEGHPGVVVDPGPPEVRAQIPVTGAVSYWAISATGGAGEERVLGVSLEKCASCHGSLLSLHGNNRNNNLSLCVTCHNAQATDIGARAEGDVQGETPIDFKVLVHGIHAANILVYGFGGSVHDYNEVTYPGEINNCGACHINQSYYPTNPDTDPRFATTFISDNFNNADFPDDVVPTAPELCIGGTNDGDSCALDIDCPGGTCATNPDRTVTLANQQDDLNRTANAAACLQCHTGQTAESHAVIPGGAKLSVKQTTDGTLLPTPGDPNPGAVETCTLCHGQGSSVCDSCDVGVGHMPWFPLQN